MFKRLFGADDGELRAIVTESLASQRTIIADLHAKAEKAAVELSEAKAENTSLRAALEERSRDFAELRRVTAEAMANAGSERPPGPTLVPRKPAFANSSIAGGHARHVPKSDSVPA